MLQWQNMKCNSGSPTSFRKLPHRLRCVLIPNPVVFGEELRGFLVHFIRDLIAIKSSVKPLLYVLVDDSIDDTIAKIC
jgi:hypothetical protein